LGLGAARPAVRDVVPRSDLFSVAAVAFRPATLAPSGDSVLPFFLLPSNFFFFPPLSFMCPSVIYGCPMSSFPCWFFLSSRDLFASSPFFSPFAMMILTFRVTERPLPCPLSFNSTFAFGRFGVLFFRDKYYDLDFYAIRTFPFLHPSPFKPFLRHVIGTQSRFRFPTG